MYALLSVECRLNALCNTLHAAWPNEPSIAFKLTFQIQLVASADGNDIYEEQLTEKHRQAISKSLRLFPTSAVR